MAKPIIDKVKDGTCIVWQQGEEGIDVGEPALAIEFFGDCICITQEESIVRINFGTVDDLCKILKGTK